MGDFDERLAEWRRLDEEARKLEWVVQDEQLPPDHRTRFMDEALSARRRADEYLRRILHRLNHFGRTDF